MSSLYSKQQLQAHVLILTLTLNINFSPKSSHLFFSP